MKMQKNNLYKLIIGIVVLVTVLEFFVAHPHYHEWYHEMIGFNIIFGFLGSWLLIILSKMIMMPILQKKEDYYEEKNSGGDDDE